MQPHKTLLRCAVLGLLATVSLLTSGCSRSVIMTTVKPDGAFTRTIVWSAMFGPGDPLISGWSQFMMQPENVARKIQAMAK